MKNKININIGIEDNPASTRVKVKSADKYIIKAKLYTFEILEVFHFNLSIFKKIRFKKINYSQDY